MKFTSILFAVLLISACAQDDQGFLPAAPAQDDHQDGLADDLELEEPPPPPRFAEDEPAAGPEPQEPVQGNLACIKGLNEHTLLIEAIAGGEIFSKGCSKASKAQIREVQTGNQRRDEFLSRCYTQTNNSCWCDQLVRPNPNSINTFYCTYPQDLPHQLIHPNANTWKHAIEAVKIVKDLEKQGIGVNIIYNWWRPEPYNRNVGGAPSRHPYGTSIDVSFANKTAQNRAHTELCRMRRRGRLRALGYYSSPALHLGVGDNRANTWGKACP